MIEIRAEDLARVASAAKAIADEKSVIPCLGAVAISGAAGILTLEATDLERYASLRAVGSGDSVEPVAVSAKGLVKSLGLFKRTDLVRVERDGEGRLVLSSGSVTRRVPLDAVPVEERPRAPDPTIVGGEVALPVAILRELLDAVEYACTADEARFWLRSILVEREGDRVRAVATDGHRISVASREWPLGPESAALADGASWRIARDLLSAAGPDRVARVRWLRGPELAEGADRAEFHEISGPGVRILYRAPSPERFPPWRQVVPSAQDKTPIAEATWSGGAGALVGQRVKKIRESTMTGIKLFLRPGAPVLATFEDEGGQLEQILPGSEVAIGPARVAVDPGYLIDTSVAAGEGAILRLYPRNDKCLADPEWTGRVGEVDRIQVVMPFVEKWSDEEIES